MKYTITLSDNSTQLNLYDLEQNGPGNISTPRHIKRVVLTGGSSLNYFEVIGDLSYRFVSWFTFTVTGSVNAGTFTVAPPGATYNSTRNVTKIPVVEVISIDRPPYGSITYTIPSSVSLALTGRGSMNFAPAFSSSIVHRLENFASSTAPTAPIKGQRWYDTTTKTIRTWDGGSFSGNVVITADSALYLTDPQNPTNSATQVAFSGNDIVSPGVGVAIRTLVNPNAQDSIFRVLTATGIEALRVEHAGHLTTPYAFKQTGSTTNEFSSDASFVTSTKGIKTATNSITSNATGTSWSITGNVSANIITVNSSTNQVGIGATISGVSVFQSGAANVNGTLNLTTHLIRNVQDPVAPQDVANKNYLNGLAAKLDVKNSVRLATNAALPVYNATGAGIGKTITGQFGGALMLDGIGVSVNNRVLVKDEIGGAAANNGVYSVFNPGVNGTPEITNVLTLADVPSSLGGKYFTISSPTDSYYVWLNNTGTVVPSINPGPFASPSPKEVKANIYANDSAQLVAMKVAASVSDIPTYTATCDMTFFRTGSTINPNILLDASANGLWISSDGTKAFIHSSETVWQFNMSTPWDTTTLSWSGAGFDVSQQVVLSGSNPYTAKVLFDPTGTIMYVLSMKDFTIHQYTLSVAWDITSASYANKYRTFYDVSFGNVAGHVFIGSAGTKLYFSGQTTIFQYTLSVAWDISTATYDSVTYSVVAQTSGILNLAFNSAGTKLLVTEGNSKRIYQYTLATPWSISTAVYDNINYYFGDRITAGFSTPYVSPDGLTLYLAGATFGLVLRYALSSPWDITTVTYVATSTSTSSSFRFTGMSRDGTKLFYVDVVNAHIFQLSLKYPWDVPSAAYENKKYNFSGTPLAGLSTYHASAFNPTGTSLYIRSRITGVVHQLSLAIPWDISTASYTSSKLLQPTNGSEGLWFKSDGTKLYFIDTSLTLDKDKIHQYGMATPWDITTATLEVKVGPFISPLATDSGANGLAFSEDGTKLYVQYNNTQQYNLSVPWDLSTAIAGPSMDIGPSPSISSTWQPFLSPIGNHLFECSAAGISKHNLPVPWDTSSATMGENSPLILAPFGGGNTTTYSIQFNPDGTRCFSSGVYSSIGTNSRLGAIAQHELTIPWDVTSLNLETPEVVVLNTYVGGFRFSSDGTQLYVCSSGMNKPIVQYTLATPWDVSSRSFIDVGGPAGTVVKSVVFNSTGTSAYALTSDYTIRQLTLSVPWSISNSTQVGNYTIPPALTSFISDIHLSPDGTKLFAFNGPGNKVNQFTLSTPWDITTTTYDSVDLAISGFGQGGLYFSPTGTQLALVSYNKLGTATLPTAWNLSGGTVTSTLNPSTQATAIKEATLSRDGTKLFVARDNTKRIYQYTLTTPDVSSAIPTKTFFYCGTQLTVGIASIAFNDTGTKLYVQGTTNKVVYQYVLSVPWDVTTATYSSVSFTASSSYATWDLKFSPDGTRMYILTSVISNAVVQQYTLSTPWDISSATLSATFNTQTNTLSESMFFAPLGDKLTIIPNMTYFNGGAAQYQLAVPWDISTVVPTSRVVAGSGFFEGGVTSAMTSPQGLYLHALVTSYPGLLTQHRLSAATPTFQTTCASNVVTVSSWTNGNTTDATAGTSGFAVSTIVQGSPLGSETVTITTTGDTTNELGNEYFLIDTPSTDYFIWYNPDSYGTAPIVPGRTAVAVPISSGDSALTIATKTAAALPGGSFSASVVGSPPSLVITNIITGAVPDAVDVSTGFTISTTQQGITGDPYVLIRSSDLDEASELTPGTLILVEEGTVNADSGWILVTNSPITMDTTPLAFVAFGGALLAFLNYDLQTGTGTAGYTTPFTFSNSSGGKTHLQVYVNGIRQKEGSAYTATAPNIVTFTTGSIPSVGADVEFYGFG